MKDVRGVDIDHGFIERETFVIGKDGKIVAAFSSKADHITPDAHVTKSLEVVHILPASNHLPRYEWMPNEICYQSARTRYKTTPCDGTTALMAPPVFSTAPVHRLCVE